MKVTKRDGTIESMDITKIIKAVAKAIKETYQYYSLEQCEEVATNLSKEIVKQLFDGITVEAIQDVVEAVLMQYEPKVAKKYILYRENRQKVWREGWKFTELQRDIYNAKYRHKNESFQSFITRVGMNNREIMKLLLDKKFIPAGRILAGLGVQSEDNKVSLANCHVLPVVEDTRVAIFGAALDLAMTFGAGGGQGVNISDLRPRGSKVRNSARTSTGAVSFMEIFDVTAKSIGGDGRRSALMISMKVDHPDIEEFISVKSNSDKITGANISVMVNDKFMNAVANNEDFDLSFSVPATGEVITKTVKAKELFRKLAKNNFDFAEPGILYWDRIENYSLMSMDSNYEVAGLNPCGEQPLPAHASCNLASINLSSLVVNPFTEDAYIDLEELMRITRLGVAYLDDILDVNNPYLPLVEQQEQSMAWRQIGIGVMGFADMLIKLGIKYGSEDSFLLSSLLGEAIFAEAVLTSLNRAKTLGAFPMCRPELLAKSPILQFLPEETLKEIAKYGLRNSHLTSIAPTGSISNLIGASSGVEPHFALSYTRKTESINTEDTYYAVNAPIVEEYLEIHPEDRDNLPNYFVTSMELPYMARIKMQATWQTFIDTAISSTVNLPQETTIEEVEDLYMQAWKHGLKGITIFRDGCERAGILSTKTKKELDGEVPEEECST